MDIFNIQKNLLDAISKLVLGEIEKNNQKNTSIVSGRIKYIEDNKITVTINQKDYTARSHFRHSPGDVVYVLVPNGNWNNLFILY